jgi:hypothetical protein
MADLFQKMPKLKEPLRYLFYFIVIFGAFYVILCVVEFIKEFLMWKCAK